MYLRVYFMDFDSIYFKLRQIMRPLLRIANSVTYPRTVSIQVGIFL